MSTDTNNKPDNNWIKKLILFLLPVPSVIPLLYLQGKAYNESYLDAFYISTQSYPLTIDETLTQAFIFYGTSWPYVSLLGMLALLILPSCNLLMEKIANKIERRESSERSKKLKTAVNERMDSIFAKNKFEMIASALLVIFGALILIVVVAVLIASYVGNKHGKEKLKSYTDYFSQSAEQKVKAPFHPMKIYLKDEDTPVEGFIITQSPDMISVLSESDISTYNQDDIKKISYLLPRQ